MKNRAIALLHIAALVVLALCMTTLAGCTTAGGLDAAIGVEPGENAVMCARVDIDPLWSESSASYRRAEVPDGVDIRTLTPEQIRALYDC